MTTEIEFSAPYLLGAVATNKTIDTTETTLLTITEQKGFKLSQLTAYFKVTLGSATSVKFKYYVSPDCGTTYYQLPTKDRTTGVLIDEPTVIDATSPTQSTAILTVEDRPIPATTALKITGTAVANTATLNYLYAYTRNN